MKKTQLRKPCFRNETVQSSPHSCVVIEGVVEPVAQAEMSPGG